MRSRYLIIISICSRCRMVKAMRSSCIMIINDYTIRSSNQTVQGYRLSKAQIRMRCDTPGCGHNKVNNTPDIYVINTLRNLSYFCQLKKSENLRFSACRCIFVSLVVLCKL